MRVLPTLGVAVVTLLAGCAPAPHVGEPIAPSELGALVDAINSGLPDADSYRGTGNGEITLSGRTVDVAFAVVYDRPGWLRADLRPALGTLGASLTTLALMEGECARLYLPARLLVVTACLSDLAEYGDWIDPASLVLGLPDASFITRMTGVTAARSGGHLTVDGLADGSPVRVKVDEELAVITEIELGREGTDDYISLTYSGHGWKSGTTVPKTVELVALEGESREVGITIRYDSLRGGEAVDRGAYDLGVPPGALEIDWKELNIWR
ncbi:MAG: hypothetical protein ABIK85_02580 [Candidatus Eisenbacteria bacterium]